MVGERQRYASLAGEDAGHFHDGEECSKSLLIANGEIERGISIGFSKNFGPGCGVKKGVPGGIQDEAIPVRMCRRVDDLHLMHGIL
jgi:hypothetical protein